MKEREAVLVLKTEVEGDLSALQRIVAKIVIPPEALAALPSTEPTVAATAFEVHKYYSISENLMRRVARAFENALDPSEWHKHLLSRMALNIPGIRPALITGEIRGQLDELSARLRDGPVS